MTFGIHRFAIIVTSVFILSFLGICVPQPGIGDGPSVAAAAQRVQDSRDGSAEAGTASRLSPVIGVSSDELEFQCLDLGLCDELDLDISNLSIDPASVLEVTDLILDGADFSLTPVSLPILVPGDGSSTTVTLQSCPADSGMGFGTLTIVAPNAANSPLAVPLSGHGGEGSVPVGDPGGPYAGQPWETIHFDGTSSFDPGHGMIASYAWNFGTGIPGSTGSGPVTHFVYNNRGVYTLTLMVTSYCGLVDYASVRVLIGDNEPPVCDAGGDIGGGQGQSIEFDGSGSSDPDGVIVHFVWEFGDGETGSGAIVEHTYTSTGTYAVELTIEDDFGAQSHCQITAEIVLPPVCDIGGPYEAHAGHPVEFDATGSFDPDGVIVSYDWGFGDGSTGSGPTPTHIYHDGGYYHVRLTVTDDPGATCETWLLLSVQGPAHAWTYTDIATTGLNAVTYVDVDPTHRRPFSGVSWGGRFFNRSFDTGCLWSGSSIVSGEDELVGCPDAILAPERFGIVELRFDSAQQGYRYSRRELVDGSSPPGGRGYVYSGYDDLPFTAWKLTEGVETQLEVMFAERQLVDGAGIPLPEQLPSHDARWMPTVAGDGDREYLNILDVPYFATPRPEYMQDGIFFGGEIPVLYGGWLRLRAETDKVDPDDLFVMHWTDLASDRDAVAAGWVDIDGDGDPDLHLVSAEGESQLFVNDGDGALGEVMASFLPIAGTVLAMMWGDYDSDGDPDLYVARAEADNLLLRNDGRLRFTDVATGPTADGGNSVDVSWMDYDLNGALDLLLANADRPNRLLRNLGGDQFTDITSDDLLEDPGAARAVAWGDFDDDGDPDLYLVKAGANQLLLNDEVFTDVTAGPLGNSLTGADAAWGDFDNDLDLDLYLANADGPNRLFRNDGGSTFTDVTVPPLDDTGSARAASWVDLDHDGRLDLHLVNFGAPSRVFHNQGDGEFAEVIIDPLRDLDDGIAAAWCDFDLDGDLDVYLANAGPNRMLRSEILLASWLEIVLVGSDSNASGVGARVRVEAGGVSQMREVTRDAGHGLTLHFGLGDALLVDLIEVRFASGVVRSLAGVTRNQRLTIQEVEPNPVELVRFEAVGAVGQVVLRWVSGREVRHAGYHVWRAEAEVRSTEIAAGTSANDYHRLTDRLLGGTSPHVFVDVEVEPGVAYHYLLEAVDLGGGSQWFGPARGASVTRPLQFVLHQNAPNPFNPATSIGFELPAPAETRLAIYDTGGRLVRLLADERREAGVHALVWNGRNDQGQVVGSGLYFYRLRAGDRTSARKMLLLR